MGVTAKELAQDLGLSEAAVSMALNNKPGVSTATRKRVWARAQELGYDFTRLSDQKPMLASGGTVAFLIYRKSGAVVADTPFFSQLSEGIDQACRELGHPLRISYLYEADGVKSQLQRILSEGCSGIILLGTEMELEDVRPFTELSVPMVLLDCYFSELSCDSVLINNIQGAYLAASFLISRFHTQPGYLHSSYSIQNFEERADGFYKAIRAGGMSPSRSLVHRLAPSLEGAYSDMKEQLQQGEKPVRCYFADNDLIAAGALKALKEVGYRVPQDVAIIGFDDLPVCEYIEPALSTVQVAKQYMGQCAVRRLHELLRGTPPACVKLAIQTKLQLRESTNTK